MKVLRNPDKTRQTILEAAFHEVHRTGFQAASLSNILAKTSITKGALYHHFPNKMAMGYAIVDELIQNMVTEMWLRPLETSEDPIECLQAVLRLIPTQLQAQDILLGCPLNNLALEMSPRDEVFRKRISHVYDLWCKGLADAFSRGQVNGKVNRNIDPLKTATFIVASLAGCRSMAKNSQSKSVMLACSESLLNYLDTLRPKTGLSNE